MPLSRTYSAPATLTINTPGQKPWVLHNYDGKGGGRMNLVDATVHSVNTVYAQLIEDVGPQRVVELASRLGIRSQLAPYLSTAIGSNAVTVLDMASAYTSFAADGRAHRPGLRHEGGRRERQHPLPQLVDRAPCDVDDDRPQGQPGAPAGRDARDGSERADSTYSLPFRAGKLPSPWSDSSLLAAVTTTTPLKALALSWLRSRAAWVSWSACRGQDMVVICASCTFRASVS